MSLLDVGSGQIVANAEESERASFIKRTYVHLAGAIAVFAVLETILIQSGVAAKLAPYMGGYAWLIVLGAFMLISTVANNWAHSGVSREKQYMGLGLGILGYALIFMPMILMAMMRDPSGTLLQNAAVVTAALVGGLTFTAFSTKINFSFMGRFLMIGGFVALGMIVASMLFGFSLGLWFSGAMIIFAAGSVLYSTCVSIQTHYRLARL